MIEITQKLYRKYLSVPLVDFCIKYNISPNDVTISNFIFTISCAVYYFSRGTSLANWFALLICGISVLLDYLDGDLASKTKQFSKLGEWLDNFGDMILQSSIMAAIGFGLCRVSPLSLSLLAAVMLYFINSSMLHAISLYYNNTFGFDSFKGNKLFRKYMDAKPTLINRILKNIIDPTSTPLALFLFTVRYWIVFGIVFNQMLFIFLCITIIVTMRMFIMQMLYALHLAKYKKLHVLQGLAILDKEREEYWKCRHTR